MAATAKAERQTEANEEGELTIIEDEEQPTGEAHEAEAAEQQVEAQDERVAGGEAAEEAADAEREARRLKRHRKKERIRTEMNFLRARNEQLERRFSETDARITGTEVASIDARIGEIDRNLQLAETVLAQALESKEPGSGKDVVAAQSIRDDLREAKKDLLAAKHQTSQRQEQTRNAPPPPDPELIAFAREFKERHPWFDFSQNDPKSQLVGRIDRALSAEGILAPNTQEFWDELEARCARYPALADDFKSRAGSTETLATDDDEDEDEDEPAPARAAPKVANGKAGGPKFTSGGRERPLRKNEVYVSAERRAALEELGVWEDPVLRKKYLAQYQKYDRENAAQRH